MQLISVFQMRQNLPLKVPTESQNCELLLLVAAQTSDYASQQGNNKHGKGIPDNNWGDGPWFANTNMQNPQIEYFMKNWTMIENYLATKNTKQKLLQRGQLFKQLWSFQIFSSLAKHQNLVHQDMIM